MIRVLFLCTGNAARSQMAEALLRELAGERFDVHSAGTEPAGLHPLTVRALEEIGIDVAGARSKAVDEYAGARWDYVVTVCDQAAERCPMLPGEMRREHWSLPDPAAVEGDEGRRLAAFREVREEMRRLVTEFARRASSRGGPAGR